MRKVPTLIVCILCVLILTGGGLFAQAGARLAGTVVNSTTGEPVDFATVVIFESQQKAYTGEDGTFSIVLPSNGDYTVQVKTDGLKPLQKTVSVNGITQETFMLQPLTIQSSGITITDEKKQKISRRTLSVQELEEVPASFGDSVSALASLPGVMTEGNGVFGQLTVRSMNPTANRYYVDGIPIQQPQHFQGIHSVIANEMMASVDLYASAYPSDFAGGMGAIIEINTLDEVNEFGGVVDVSAISTTALVRTPTYKMVFDGATPRKEKDGYFIVSGRVGYLTLLIPPIYQLATGDKLSFSLPNYWDYQVKYKHYFDSHNSLTMLAFGSKDWWVDFEVDEETVEEEAKNGIDPLLAEFEFDTDLMFHNVGIYYTYSTGKISNTTMAYGCLPEYYRYMNLGHEEANEALKDVELTAKPYEFGVKNETNFEWWKNHGELTVGVEYVQYRFAVEGETIILSEVPGSGAVDELGSDLLTTKYLDDEYINHKVGSYLYNSFTLGGLTFVPQVRVDYLDRAKTTNVDPRGRISYEFPSKTVLAYAGGKYHQFNQINPYNFQNAPEQAGDGEEIQPEQSIHNSLSIEQPFGFLTVSLEGFYNYYYDLLSDAPHEVDGEHIWAKNEGEKRSYGAELMIHKDYPVGTNDYFGWLSYTYTQSEERTGLSGDTDDPRGTGSTWYPSAFENEHAVKMVLGYKLGNHTFTGKFQLYTTQPYTEIIGSEEDEDYAAYYEELGENKERHVPVYSSNYNAKHLPLYYQLDVRYSYQTSYKWGSVKFYIEAINLSGLWYHPDNDYVWDYTKKYEKGSNPRKVSDADEGLSVLPNIGVEVRF